MSTPATETIQSAYLPVARQVLIPNIADERALPHAIERSVNVTERYVDVLYKLQPADRYGAKFEAMMTEFRGHTLASFCLWPSRRSLPARLTICGTLCHARDSPININIKIEAGERIVVSCDEDSGINESIVVRFSMPTGRREIGVERWFPKNRTFILSQPEPRIIKGGGDGVCIVDKEENVGREIRLRRSMINDWDDMMDFACNLPVRINQGVVMLTIHTGVIAECAFRDFAYSGLQQGTWHFRMPVSGGLLPLELTSYESTMVQLAVSVEVDGQCITDIYMLGSAYFYGGEELTPVRDDQSDDSDDGMGPKRSDGTRGGVSVLPFIRTGVADNVVWQPGSGNPARDKAKYVE